MKALILCLVLASVPMFADVIIGLPADAGIGNCFPFSCGYSGRYQQVYTQSQFAGLINITDLHFFNTTTNGGGTALGPGTWTISLSTTSADWNTLSGAFASNIGADSTIVFSGNLGQSWSFGDTLSIILATPFLYNPAAGNLLMDVKVADAADPAGIVYFDTNGYNSGSLNGNTIMGRVFNDGVVNSGYGLVTDFTTSTVPEPSFGTLLGVVVGLLGIAGVIRRETRDQ